MKKLLLITPNPALSGGVNVFINNLTHYLEKKDLEIQFVRVGKTDNTIKNIFYPLLIIKQLIQIKDELYEFNPDIVHLNPSFKYTAIFRDLLFLKLIKNKKYPTVLFIHGWDERLSHIFFKPFLRVFIKKNISKSDAIIVLAQQFKEILKKLNVNEENIHLSTTMVDTKKFKTGEKTFNSPFTILFCSTLLKQKGIIEFLKAINIVLKKYSSLHVFIIGDGPYKDQAIHKTKELNLGKIVTFTGHLNGNDLINHFKKSHLFVLPSYSEGFPTVAIEAMAAGLPIITTPVGGLKDAITNEKEGLLIKQKPINPAEIAKHIINLLENPDLMKKISNHNQQKAKEKYDISYVCNQIIELYKQILNKNN